MTRRNEMLDRVEALARQCLEQHQSRKWLMHEIEALEFFSETEVDELLEEYRGYWR